MMAGHIAFMGLFAIFPFLIFLALAVSASARRPTPRPSLGLSCRRPTWPRP